MVGKKNPSSGSRIPVDFDIPGTRMNEPGFQFIQWQLVQGEQPDPKEIARRLRFPGMRHLPEIVAQHIADLVEGKIPGRRGRPRAPQPLSHTVRAQQRAYLDMATQQVREMHRHGKEAGETNALSNRFQP